VWLRHVETSDSVWLSEMPIASWNNWNHRPWRLQPPGDQELKCSVDVSAVGCDRVDRVVFRMWQRGNQCFIRLEKRWKKMRKYEHWAKTEAYCQTWSASTRKLPKASHQRSKSTHQLNDVMLPGVLLFISMRREQWKEAAQECGVEIASVLLWSVEGNIAKRVSSLRKHTVSPFNHWFYSFVFRDA